MITLSKIGFFQEWKDTAPPYCLLDKNTPYDKDSVLSYLEKGVFVREWLEYRECCFQCGAKGVEDLGDSEFTDGVWVWSDELIHYVNHHDIDLPPAFLSHLQENNYIANVSEPVLEVLKRGQSFPSSSHQNKILYSGEIWEDWVSEKKNSLSDDDLERLKLRDKPFVSNSPPPDLSLPDDW